MNIKEVEVKAKRIRQEIFKTSYHAGGGHMGAAFSVTDIIATLYFGDILKYDAQNPLWEGRDRFVLSKGHACYALYSALALAGYFDSSLLRNVGKPCSKLGGHPKLNDIPGVEASTGALGHGLSFSIGMALAHKIDGKDNHFYVVLGDGECQEGSIWEAALSAPTLKLGNLTVIIDHNKLQAMDCLENIVRMKPFGEKWRSFGWNVIEIDGHDISQIHDALITRIQDMPTVVIANTVKGKGVSFMENEPIWHYRMPNEAELPVLLKDLDMTMEDLK